MEDYNAVYFAIEILNATFSNGDARKPGQVPSSKECVLLAEKLLNQKCEKLIPESEEDYLSYIELSLDPEISFPEVSDILSDAMQDLVPVQIDAGTGFAPLAKNFLLSGLYRSHSQSTGWNNLPAYGNLDDWFPAKSGYKPWFAIFSDTIGISLCFYYPENPSGVIEIIYKGIDLGGFKIYWKHGVPGLCDFLQVIYFEWLVRNYSYGIVEN